MIAQTIEGKKGLTQREIKKKTNIDKVNNTLKRMKKLGNHTNQKPKLIKNPQNHSEPSLL